MYNKELLISKKAAKEAGKFLKKEFNLWKRGSEKKKKHNETVTWCDKKAEQIIFKHIKKAFPKYNILSEESGLKNKSSEYSWIVDPLDGTNNFTVHNPLFTTSIALLHKNEVVIGIIYVPMIDEMYYVVKNKGAYKNNKKIKVSAIKKIKDSYITYCHGLGIKDHKKAFQIYENFHIKARGCRHLGSTTLELAMVANGYTEALIIPSTKLWDIAAGILLIQEAGGNIIDFKGNDWNIKSKSLIATNGNIDKNILNYIKKNKLD